MAGSINGGGEEERERLLGFCFIRIVWGRLAFKTGDLGAFRILAAFRAARLLSFLVRVFAALRAACERLFLGFAVSKALFNEDFSSTSIRDHGESLFKAFRRGESSSSGTSSTVGFGGRGETGGRDFRF